MVENRDGIDLRPGMTVRSVTGMGGRDRGFLAEVDYLRHAGAPVKVVWRGDFVEWVHPASLVPVEDRLEIPVSVVEDRVESDRQVAERAWDRGLADYLEYLAWDKRKGAGPGYPRNPYRA